MAENTVNISVLSYLKKGVSANPVTKSDIDSYFKDFVLKNPKLPIHYQSQIEEILRNSGRGNELHELLTYLAEELNVVAFFLGENKVVLRGLNNLYYHSDFPRILDLFENERNLWKFFDDNFSMYPIFLETNITFDGKDIFDISVVSGEFGTNRLGFVGGLNMDYDLAVGILDFLRKK